MGVAGKDKKLGNTILATALLSEHELEQLYKVGLIRRYVDSIPEAMLRHRPTIKLSSEENTKDTLIKFDSFLKATQFHQALREVIQLQRIYGGAGLVLLIDDGLAPEEPVNPARIRAIRGYVPLSRHELVPEDVSFTDYSKPEHYRISTNQKLEEGQTESYVNVTIHHSRVARFDGLYLPWNLRAPNTGWGQSVIEVIWDAWQDYTGAIHGLGNLIGEGDLLVHQIPGLMQRIAAGGEADIRKRLELNNMARSIYGAMVLDKEESLTNLSRNLTNLSSATEPFVRHLQAATGWPASILMGDSPGGLGKEGRFEERVWASLVEQWQEVYCRTPITEIFQYILASREGPTGGKPPEDWEVHFPSVFTETDKERAELREITSRSDNTYLQMGVLNAVELRESRFGKPEFSIETTLNDTITDQLQLQADMQFQQQVAGFEAQQEAAQAGAMPPGEPDQPPEDGAPPPEGEASPTGDDDSGGIALPDAGPGGPSPADVLAEEPDDTRRRPKTDAFDHYAAQGLRIRVTHTAGDIRAGHLVAPDGQRIDAAAQTLMVFGPHRTRSYKLYRASFDGLDGALVPGPYVTGFASLRAARQGVASLFPRQSVAGLTPLPEHEIQALRAGWETYS